MREEHITFGTEYRLSGKWCKAEPSKALVVFSHPHPAYGGSMDNNVVRLCCHYLNRKNISTLRYNFRGVGLSEGDISGGLGEQEDMLLALTEAAQKMNDSAVPVVMVSYSFGAWVNWMVLDKIKKLDALIFISPPLGMEDFQFKKRDNLKLPLFSFIGENDDLCKPEVFKKEIKRIANGSLYEIVSGVDHLWTRHEMKLADKIGDKIDSMLS